MPVPSLFAMAVETTSFSWYAAIPMIVGPINASTFFVPGLEKVFFRDVKETRHPVLRTNGSWNNACIHPPTITPMDIALAALSGSPEFLLKRYVKRITMPLKRTGVNPLGAKTPQPLRMP